MPATTSTYVIDFADISLRDLASVGGKNASLGELFRALKPKGVGVLDGFATTAHAYRCLLGTDGLQDRLRSIFTAFDQENLIELSRRGGAGRGPRNAHS
jgi:pyruvate, water dikinase